MYNNLQRFGSTAKPWTLAVLLASVFPTASNAFEFSNESGSVTGSFDTTISLGASWRMEDRDPELIGITNGGTARSVNGDDGNLNFDKHDLISSIAKVTHDFDLAYQNYGFFARGFYFYDHVASEKNALGREARDLAGSEAKLRDAYLRASYKPGGRALNLRLGAQVVSWGESTFIQNGINVINPIDVGQLRTPGSELREALISMPMIWGSQEVSDTVTVEAFVLGDHDKIRIDPRGTFFSTSDSISDDGDRIFAGFGRRQDQHQAPGVFGVDADAAGWLPRAPDRNPSDSGEFGIAFRLLAPELNSTEFGFYAIRYHSRLPLVSANRGGLTVDASPVPGCTVINLPGGIPGGCGATPATYFVEYPEDIRLYGISFNTSVGGGVALQGEYSYRPNFPLQIATPEVILASLGLRNQITGNDAQAAGVPFGTEISGFRRVKAHQVQITATKAFGPTFGANQLILLGEAGYNKFELPDDVKFNSSNVFLPSPTSQTSVSAGSSQQGGYLTENSWGYRVVARMDFNNAIGAAALSPRVAFSHDVNGVGINFNEDTKAATVGLTYNLREKWLADIAYTSFFGGQTFSGTDPAATGAQPQTFASSGNPLKDRDFLAVSVSYAF